MEVISGPCDFSEPGHGLAKLVHVEMYYILRAGTVSLSFRDPERDPQASGLADSIPEGVTICQEMS